MFSFFFVWKHSSVILLMYAEWMLMISVKFLALEMFAFKSWLMKCSTVVIKWLSSDCREYISQLRSNAKRLNVIWTMFGSPYSTVFLKWTGKRRFSSVQMPHFILSRKRNTESGKCEKLRLAHWGVQVDLPLLYFSMQGSVMILSRCSSPT